MSEITISDMHDVASPDPRRPGKLDKLITYTVDGARAYQTRMPKEEFTPEAAQKQITAEELERLKLVGKTFSVGPPAAAAK